MAEEQLNPETLTAVRRVPGTRAQALAYIQNGGNGVGLIGKTPAGRFVQVFNGWQSVMCDDGELTVGQVEATAWMASKPVFSERRETARIGEERREDTDELAMAVLADLVDWHEGAKRERGSDSLIWARAHALLAKKAKGEAA